MAATANYTQTMMYWHIGERINREVLGNQRAEYGKQIVSQVATQLQNEYGKKGFEPRNIRRMMQFAQEFSDEHIVVTASRQLSWSHFVKILPFDVRGQVSDIYNKCIQAELMHGILIHFRGKCALYRVKVCNIRTSLKNIL